MKSKQYWKEWSYRAGVRAVKTMAQAAIGCIGAATMFSQIDVRVVVSTAVLSGVISVLTSVAGLPEVGKEG